MTSIAAERVAKEILSEVGNGRIPHKEQIQLKHGYSKISARKGKAIQTQAYKRIMKPLADQLEEERQAILLRMPKVRNKAKYRDLSDALDKVTKVKQLITGRATENISVVTISDEDKKRLDSLLNDKQTSSESSN